MRVYRIKQIDENRFIPQVAEGLIDIIFFLYTGIDPNDKSKWYSGFYQKEKCVVYTLDRAKEIISEHKLLPKYPIYHKM